MKKRLKLSDYFGIVKDTIKAFGQENATGHSASIAFYTIFSLPGILIVIIRLAGAFFGEALVKGELSERIHKAVGPEASKEIQGIIENAEIVNTSSIMTYVGLLVLVFSATTVFTIIQQSLNAMWGVKAKPKKGWLKFIKNRFLSFGMVLALGFLMMFSLLIDFFVVIFGDFIDKVLEGDYSQTLSLASGIFTWVVMVVVFALIFKVLPDVKIRWSDVTVGAVVTTILFTIGKYLIGLYLTTSNLNTTYGAAGSIVLILMWVNYSAMIMLVGAEFTQVYTKYIGRTIQPSANAVRIQITEIEG